MEVRVGDEAEARTGDAIQMLVLAANVEEFLSKLRTITPDQLTNEIVCIILKRMPNKKKRTGPSWNLIKKCLRSIVNDPLDNKVWALSAVRWMSALAIYTARGLLTAGIVVVILTTPPTNSVMLACCLVMPKLLAFKTSQKVGDISVNTYIEICRFNRFRWLRSVKTVEKAAKYFNVSVYLIRKARKLKEEQGILTFPPAKSGKVLPEHVSNLIADFYQDDEYSRLMPGRKDFVCIGKNVHMQKRLMLTNLNELYQDFKKKLPQLKVGFSKFCSLRPKWCILSDSTGSHNVCVCTYHQNAKLAIAGIKWDNTYTDLYNVIVCDFTSSECMIHRCPNCPGIDALKTFLDNQLSGMDDLEDIIFNQWQCVDRTTLIIQTMPLYNYKEFLCEKIDNLTIHSYISKVQGQYINNREENKFVASEPPKHKGLIPTNLKGKTTAPTPPKDDPVLSGEFDLLGFGGYAQNRSRNEFSCDYSPYLDIVDESYTTLCLDRTFSRNVSASMFQYACIQAFWHRLCELLVVGGFGNPDIDRFLQATTIIKELPAPITAYLKSIGSLSDETGTIYWWKLLCEYLPTHELHNNVPGFMGRVSHNTHFIYETMPSPGISMLSIMSDIAYTMDPINSQRLGPSCFPLTTSFRVRNADSKSVVLANVHKAMVDSAGKIKMSDPKNGPDKGSSAQVPYAEKDFKRTVKTYCCIALGKPIVTSDWLNNSKVAKSFSGLQLRKMISQLSNIMSSIYSQHWNWPKKKPMLTGFKIHVTEGVKPPPTEMKDIIQCAGAKVSAVLIF
ncbi:Mediator of DNA damage checkpoint protein 1 [Nymphon striatum]|nr:Mediator of DNA damage checkpoint protein 1 [Nymphon striatum]